MRMPIQIKREKRQLVNTCYIFLTLPKAHKTSTLTSWTLQLHFGTCIMNWV